MTTLSKISRFVGRRGMEFGPCYRTVEESTLVDALLLAGFALETDRATARQHATRALQRWRGDGLEAATDAAGLTRFDPVEVMTFFKRAGVERDDPFWSERFVSTARGMVASLPADPGAEFHVELRRTFSLGDTRPGAAVRLRMPLPLSSVHGEPQHVEAFVEGAPADSHTCTDGRVECRMVPEGQSTVTLGARFTVGGMRPPALVSAAHRPQEYLKPTEGMIVITPAVSALASTLADEGQSQEVMLRAFWDFLMDELVCGPVHYDQVDVAAPCDWVLRTGCYDCHLGSALLIALCRARGIPARLVSGHFLYAGAPTNHFWAEAWTGDRGWLPFDSWCWDLSAGGRDRDWREHFFGRIDHRLVMQRLPYEFTGPVGVKLPQAWHMLQLPQDDGVSIRFESLDGHLAYRDDIRVAPRRDAVALDYGKHPPSVV